MFKTSLRKNKWILGILTNICGNGNFGTYKFKGQIVMKMLATGFRQIFGVYIQVMNRLSTKKLPQLI